MATEQLVKAAQLPDEDQIYEMLLELHQENGIFVVDEERVRSFIREATEQRGAIIGVIRGETGELEASVGMVIDQWWYTLEWCLSERWLFVKPQCRRSTHARRLVDYAKHAAEKMGIPLQMGIMSTQSTAKKEALYARKMTRLGGIYMWDANQEIKTGGKQDQHH